jgi:hypothetical protein
MSKMKNVKLVLLGVLVATMGLVSCETEDSVSTEQIQGKTNSLGIYQKDSKATQDENQKEILKDTSVVYSREEDHGDKGDSKPKGDD